MTIRDYRNPDVPYPRPKPIKVGPTIDEAIEVLTQHQKGTDPLYLPKLPEAEKLGIEALERIVYLPKDMDCPHFMTLPGETEE